ncbi:toxin glutamine deamidase domain-containing protein [Actinosynnema sp. CS-041913]|uniref:toxin glutamine deamidase domain-containing protein n=1 Tax=Actinosynnema sp. CS-041913 TaxID=3239917 RepID=UPI003D9226E5
MQPEQEELPIRRRRDPDRSPAASELRAHSTVPAGAAELAALQRAVGNRAVVRLLAHRHGAPVDPGPGGPVPAASDVAVQRAPADRTRIPETLDEAREDLYFRPGGLVPASPEAQSGLEAKFPKTKSGEHKKFPKPYKGANIPFMKLDPADWLAALNSQYDEDPRFRSNCQDATRAFLASWFGNPKAASGVFDRHEDGTPGIESNGAQATQKWLGAPWRASEDSPDGGRYSTPADVKARLSGAGPGSAAMVVFRPEGRQYNHAVNAVNYKGSIFWIDPQNRKISREFDFQAASLMMIVVKGSDFEPVDAPELNPMRMSVG